MEVSGLVLLRSAQPPLDEVLAAVDDHTIGSALGFLGDRGVKVLELNLALDDVG